MASGLYCKKKKKKVGERDYKKEYKYHATAKAKKQRARNNKANRDMGTYGNGDGLDVAHSKPSALGRIYKQSPSKNRSFKRTKSAKRKKT